MTNVFVSYSRRDIDFAAKVVDALAENAFDAWIDWKSIPKAEDWEAEIYRGIEAADAFIYLISPDAIQARMCNLELAHAVKNGKRVLPILIREIDPRSAPAEISKRNWIFCREQLDDFQNAIDQIRYTIQTDYAWLKYHTRLQIRALEWQRGKDSSRLLRGAELREAVEKITSNNNEPAPTDLQRLFVLASQKATDRLRRGVTLGLTFSTVIFAALGVFSFNQSRLAIAAQQTAIGANRTAISAQQTQVALISSLTSLTAQAQTSSFTPSPTYTVQPTTTFTSTPTKLPTETLTPIPITETISPVQATATLEKNIFTEIIQKGTEEAVIGGIAAIGSVFAIYFLSVIAIKISKTRSGSSFFSRTWLINAIQKTSKIAPGMTRKLLFSGYKIRLLDYPEIFRSSKDFFGLPALDPNENLIAPDEEGENLNKAICNILGSQKPVLILGNAGAGKSTLLARWTYLGLMNKLPDVFKGYTPILVDPVYYEGDLTEAIAATLNERDDLPVNVEIVQTMLETGKYLILFDGISEIGDDQSAGANEIIRTAKHANFKNNRFLITSRPSVPFPSDIQLLHLQPLTLEVIQNLLNRYSLKTKKEKQFTIQLKAFGMDTIEPLLFSMMISQGEISYSRSQLYELYFCRKLKLTITEMSWDGWQVVLEELAKMFMLESGRRGVGISHEKLLKNIDGDGGSNLIKRLGTYGVYVKNELEMLEKLRAAGLLSGKRRWRFAQDSFEEYFAAGYIISQMEIHEIFPYFPLWADVEDQQRAFLGTIEFIREMSQELAEKKHEHTALTVLRQTDLPIVWKESLFPSQHPNIE